MRTCSAPDCLNPVRHGELCDTHAKRAWRARQAEGARGKPLSGPVQAKNRSPRQAFLDAVHRYVDADSADDTEFRRARWALEQAGRRYFAGAKGGVGRPRSVDADDVARLFRQLKSVRGVARHLGASKDAVWRALSKSPLYRKFRDTSDSGRKPRDGES